MRNFILFVYSLFIIFCIVLACMYSQEKKEKCDKSYNGFATERELQAMRYLHRYHGTMSSQDGMFLRDGEWCSLYDPRVRTDR